MVYSSNTAAVKSLLKEKGFLGGKGRTTRSKVKKQINIKSVTNISIGSCSTLDDDNNDDDEFTLNIPINLLTSEKTNLQNNNANSTKIKYVNKIISNKKTKPKIENPVRKPTQSSIKKLPREMEPSKPKISPIALQNPLKSDTRQIPEETDEDDEFTIRLSPEQIKSFYNNHENNTEKLVRKSTNNRQVPKNNTQTNWHSSNSIENCHSDDDDEFTITIPTFARNKTEKLFS